MVCSDAFCSVVCLDLSGLVSNFLIVLAHLLCEQWMVILLCLVWSLE